MSGNVWTVKKKESCLWSENILGKRLFKLHPLNVLDHWDHHHVHSNQWTWMKWTFVIMKRHGFHQRFQQKGKWFSEAGNSFWTELLYKKKIASGGQTRRVKIILIADQFARCPALSETVGHKIILEKRMYKKNIAASFSLELLKKFVKPVEAMSASFPVHR